MSAPIAGPGLALGPAPSVGVVTIVAGRRDHLRRQLEGLARQDRPADQLVVVRMDQAAVAAPASVQVIDVPLVEGRLPLAAARNAGVQALETEVSVLLDVDCIPGRALIAGYATAAASTPATSLLCSRLRYLETGIPGPDGDWDEAALIAGSRAHPGRPQPESGVLLRDDRHELAWTTSLALRTEFFHQLGGFDERFTGYGGEDTDFGVRAAQAGAGVWWSGDAVAYHQHHESQSPPRQHMIDIVRNAQLFADLHGWYPMEGWLRTFDREGLIDFDPAAGRLRLLATP
jgi:N-acetylglucosaminyl-diphospho-decaprenol L-rhamnosyltransferase